MKSPHVLALFACCLANLLTAQDNLLPPDSLSRPPVAADAWGKNRPQRDYLAAVDGAFVDEWAPAGQSNLAALFKGRCSGLEALGTAGLPGASVAMTIRGRRSYYNDNQPLILLDGIPVDNSEWGNGPAGVDLSNRLIDFNVLDIESVSLLKGPLATALYGLRGANGVLLLQSRQGRASRPRITLQTTFLVDQVNQLPERQSRYAQGRPMVGEPVWQGPETFEYSSWGPALSTLEFDGSAYPFDQHGRLVPLGAGNGRLARAYDPYDFFVNGLTRQVHVSVDGGSAKLAYYLSGGHLHAGGFAPMADYRKLNFTGRLHARLGEKLQLGMSTHAALTGGYRLQKGSASQSIMLGIARTPPSFDNGNGNSGRAAAENMATYQLPDGSQRSYRWGLYDNPYWSVNKNPFEDEVFRLLSYLSLRYRPNGWLQFTGRAGWDQYDEDRQSGIDRNPGIGDGQAAASGISHDGLHLEGFARIAPPMTGPFQLSVHVGGNYVWRQTQEQTILGFGLAHAGDFDPSRALQREESQVTIRKQIGGALAAVDLNYRDFLQFNLSARQDWSSALPAGKHGYLSYALAGGIVLTELPGWKMSGPLNFLKVHAGYGRAANDPPAHLTGNYFETANIGGDLFLADENPVVTTNGLGLSPADVLGSNQLRPETTASTEAGLHFGLWRDRLGGRMVYYDERTTDVLLPAMLPGSSGYTRTVSNAGVIRNEGLEVDIWTRPVLTGKIEWRLSVNFTRNRNRVEVLPGPEEGQMLNGFSSPSAQLLADAPYGAIFGEAFSRDRDGNLLIDRDGWPLVDWGEKRILANPNPDWTLGLENRLRLGRGLTISALLEIRYGGDRWCGTCGSMDYFGTSQRSADEIGRDAVFDGVQATGAQNEMVVPLADPNFGRSSYYRVRYGFGGLPEMSIYPAGWIRLRTLGIQYDLARLLRPDSAVDKLVVSLLAHNLWLHTAYPGVDPETSFGGVSNGIGLDYFNTPGARSFGTSITLSF